VQQKFGTLTSISPTYIQFVLKDLSRPLPRRRGKAWTHPKLPF